MTTDKVTKGSGNWKTISMAGSFYENQIKVMEYLDRYNGKYAKVLEGSDGNANTFTFIVLKGEKNE